MTTLMLCLYVAAPGLGALAFLLFYLYREETPHPFWERNRRAMAERVKK